MSLSVGAIGLGGLGHVQCQSCAEIDGVDVVAGADVAPDARDSFEEVFGVPTYESHEELLAEHDLDAALIVTPHTLHYEQTKTCLEAGVHVHLEKPMVTRVDHAVELIELGERRNLVLQVGYQRHFTHGYQEIKRVIEEGRIGDVHMVSCYLGQDWIRNQNGTWRSNPELSGGGQLIDSGSHLLDALLWTTVTVPRTVSALMEYREHDVDVNTAIAATLEGDGGPVMASIGITGDGTGFEEGLTIWGTDGHLTYGGGDLLVEEGGQIAYTASISGMGYQKETRVKLEAFFEAVRGERETAVPGEYGLQVTALTEAAYRSRESGQPVDAQALIEDARNG